MKYKEFRTADLMILSILAFVSEFLGYLLVEKMDTPFYLSFSFAICIIAMIRWGVVGVITYLIAGVSLLFLKDVDDFTASLFFEVVANVGIVIPFVIILKKDRDVFVNDLKKFILLTFCCVVSLVLVKGTTVMVFNANQTGIIDYFSSTLLIILVNLGLLIVLAYTKSQLLLDMKKNLTSDCQNQEE